MADISGSGVCATSSESFKGVVPLASSASNTSSKDGWVSALSASEGLVGGLSSGFAGA